MMSFTEVLLESREKRFLRLVTSMGCAIGLELPKTASSVREESIKNMDWLSGGVSD